MSTPSKFKIKRPHSPDHSGIFNYKKQRLLQDLENLSLAETPVFRKGDSHNVTHQHSSLSSPKDNFGSIYLPYSPKNHTLKLLQPDHQSLSDCDLIYNKLKELVRNEALQMVKWVDKEQLVYSQWFKWLQRHESDFDMDDGYKKDNFELQEFKKDYDEEGDIDMDT